jgi:DNA-binding transcriptional MerR regulator/effector-binding domain-containing protein
LEIAMFKIGEFSRLTRVSSKTLHHYDEIGLFKPSHVAPFTGYRYYTAEQLPRLNRLLALRALGFSLEQIGRVLDGGLNADELRGMLRLRRAELERERAEADAKLAEVEIRLRQIEQEGTMPQIDILTKSVEPLTVAGARETVPSPELMRPRCMALNDMACVLIERHKLKTDWVSLALYYDVEDGIDVEMAYPVEPPAAPVNDEAGQVHTLPAATVAYAVYRGSYDDFGAVGQVHVALKEWLVAHGYTLGSPSREIYLRPPQGPNDLNAVMEIQYPI